MSDIFKNQKRVIAVDPTSRGFGYVVFEGKDRLIYWGTVRVSGPKYQECLERFNDLVERFAPDMLVVEDYLGQGSRRVTRVKRLIHGLTRRAEAGRIKVRRFSPVEVREALTGEAKATKEELAATIASRYPELGPHLPPHRKCWMPEDLRMSVFDAAGLALTAFEVDSQQRQRRAA